MVGRAVWGPAVSAERDDGDKDIKYERAFPCESVKSPSRCGLHAGRASVGNGDPCKSFSSTCPRRTPSTYDTRRHVLGCRSCDLASPVCEGQHVRKNTHRRSLADMAGDADGNGEWVVGRSENAAYRSRTSWGSRCGAVARNHRYGRPSDWGCRLDCLLGSNCGRSVTQADQRGIGYEPTACMNASRNVSGCCAPERVILPLTTKNGTLST